MRSGIVALALLLCFASLAQAHSWLECADWRPAKEGDWTNGVCKGRPRRWGTIPDDNGKPFDCYREFRQDQHPGVVCNPNREGPHLNPTSSMYSTDNPMTETTAGGRLCWRWPAKNHADEKGYQTRGSRLRDHPVFVQFSPPMTDTSSDPSQQTLLNNRVVGIDYQDCDVLADNSQDKRPCGGCFNIPNDMTPGTYLAQWWWEFNDGEIYISCADIKINAGGTPAAAPTYPNGYLGCYDKVTGDGNSLSKREFSWSDYPDNSKGKTNSPAVCVAACKAAGYKYAGMMFSTECYCGNTEPAIAARTDGLVECSMFCTGNENQKCGGNTAASVYDTSVQNSGATGGVVDPGTGKPAGTPTSPGGGGGTKPTPTTTPTGGGGGAGTPAAGDESDQQPAPAPAQPAADQNAAAADSKKSSSSSSGMSPGGAAALSIFIIAMVVCVVAGVIYYRQKGHLFGYHYDSKSGSVTKQGDSYAYTRAT